eukprot:CAMPEP_0178405920 /NCGR_PEP_ID=MMETSP0689_2-20121128/18648_1 /TAXON_ID=160604 /ORGANISM="Amphidinium massartii, Strain CS-259" /LENGTH=765 /DNA_ID=CAMNT_0020026951 /DNA_START=57 /DNA_END=2354 /DNA_ORIENTATION=-
MMPSSARGGGSVHERLDRLEQELSKVSGVAPQQQTPRLPFDVPPGGGALRGVGALMMAPAPIPPPRTTDGSSSARGDPHERLQRLEQEIATLKGASLGVAPPMSTPIGPPMLLATGSTIAPRAHGDCMALSGYTSNSTGYSKEHLELMSAHKDLLNIMKDQTRTHMELMNAHKELLKSQAAGPPAQKGRGAAVADKKKHPKLGVIRLDYNYPPAEGDIDCPASFGYDVIFRVVPKMTFEMAQAGKFTEEVEREFAEGIKYLEMQGCDAITGDCGFMMAFQVLARKIATKPIFMSSMVQCPVLAAAFDQSEKILVLTANSNSLKPQKEVLMSSCGFDVEEDRFHIVGCENVPGFEAVAKGEKVPLELVTPGILKLVTEELRKNPKITGILLECTELPPYADALRAATELPVWDAITAADFYISSRKDNPRFGINDWQAEWDGTHDEYVFGQNLTEMDREALVHKAPPVASAPTQPGAQAKPKKAPKKQDADKLKKKLKKKQNPILGILRLDYNYPPAKGDIDCPGSYEYDCLFRMVPGLTFEMAQSGKLTFAVEQEFRKAIKWLEAKGAAGITGDCGFMMAFQPLARQIAAVPVFMSSMMQCPMISIAFDKYDKILILTANSESLAPQKERLLSECGFDVDDDRFIIRGCQDVPGFDAVAKGAKVDVDKVTPGIVALVKDVLSKEISTRAILLECTELPPYSDALRMETGLSVFDAITNADFFISAVQDNPRFGLNQWQMDWDGVVEDYKLGDNLTAEQRAKAKFV